MSDEIQRDREPGTGHFAPGNTLGRRFAPGCAPGPGNPLAGKIERLRAALVKAVTKADIEDIAKVLIRNAKGGDVASAREVLDRVLGRSTQAVVVASASADDNRLQVQILENPEALELANQLAQRLAETAERKNQNEGSAQTSYPPAAEE